MADDDADAIPHHQEAFLFIGTWNGKTVRAKSTRTFTRATLTHASARQYLDALYGTGNTASNRVTVQPISYELSRKMGETVIGSPFVMGVSFLAQE